MGAIESNSDTHLPCRLRTDLAVADETLDSLIRGDSGGRIASVNPVDRSRIELCCDERPLNGANHVGIEASRTLPINQRRGRYIDVPGGVVSHPGNKHPSIPAAAVDGGGSDAVLVVHGFNRAAVPVAHGDVAHGARFRRKAQHHRAGRAGCLSDRDAIAAICGIRLPGAGVSVRDGRGRVVVDAAVQNSRFLKHEPRCKFSAVPRAVPISIVLGDLYVHIRLADGLPGPREGSGPCSRHSRLPDTRSDCNSNVLRRVVSTRAAQGASKASVAPRALSGPTARRPMCSRAEMPALPSSARVAARSRTTNRAAARRAPALTSGGSTPKCRRKAAGSMAWTAPRGVSTVTPAEVECRSRTPEK